MNAFGNKLKLLRETHNLTQTDLGEILELSPQFISFLERGVRKPSEETIDKVAKQFNIDREELLQLRGETLIYPVSSGEARQAKYSLVVRQLAETLMLIEEDEREKMTTHFLGEINKTLLGLLRPYSFREVKNEVLAIRSCWIDTAMSEVVSIPEEKNTIVLKGCLQLDHSIFFSIEYDSNMMKLMLQATHFDYAKEFDKWMDPHHVSYMSEEMIPHLSEKQKIVNFLWFAPIASYPKRMKILEEQQVKFNDLIVYDIQLTQLTQPRLAPKDDQVS